MKIGQLVRWKSSSQGVTKEKIGIIVGIIPEKTQINVFVDKYFPNHSKSKIKAAYDSRLRRDHMSYLVSIKNLLYWPLVNNLKEELP